MARLNNSNNDINNRKTAYVLYFYEEPSKRKLKVVPSVNDIAMEVNNGNLENILNEDLNNKNKQLNESNKKLESIPEEEEKL